MKEAMTAVAEMLFNDHKGKTETSSAIVDVQLWANTVARRLCCLRMWLNSWSRTWFSIQCYESVHSSDTAQRAVFIRFEDVSIREELFTLLPLKTSTRGVDMYNAVKVFLSYHCIHQQAMCTKALRLNHVMAPGIKIITAIGAKEKQHGSIKLFLEDCSKEYGHLLLRHSDVR